MHVLNVNVKQFRASLYTVEAHNHGGLLHTSVVLSSGRDRRAGKTGRRVRPNSAMSFRIWFAFDSVHRRSLRCVM